MRYLGIMQRCSEIFSNNLCEFENIAQTRFALNSSRKAARHLPKVGLFVNVQAFCVVECGLSVW